MPLALSTSKLNRCKSSRAGARSSVVVGAEIQAFALIVECPQVPLGKLKFKMQIPVQHRGLFNTQPLLELQYVFVSPDPSVQSWFCSEELLFKEGDEQGSVSFSRRLRNGRKQSTGGSGSVFSYLPCCLAAFTPIVEFIEMICELRFIHLW